MRYSAYHTPIHLHNDNKIKEQTQASRVACFTPRRWRLPFFSMHRIEKEIVQSVCPSLGPDCTSFVFCFAFPFIHFRFVNQILMHLLFARTGGVS